jgi:hypothetical protein
MEITSMIFARVGKDMVKKMRVEVDSVWRKEMHDRATLEEPEPESEESTTKYILNGAPLPASGPLRILVTILTAQLYANV